MTAPSDVTSLSLGKQGDAEAEIRALASEHERYPKLTALYLNNIRVTRTALAALFASPLGARLETLSLVCSLGTGVELGALAQVQTGALRVLQLGWNERLEPEWIRSLVAKPIASTLRVLGLESSRLDDRAATALAKAPNLGALEVLELRSNPITRKGALALLRSATLPRLQRLVLAETSLGEDDDGALAALLKLKRIAHVVVLGGSYVDTDEGRAKLTERFGDRVSFER
jgi:hypothetical protein